MKQKPSDKTYIYPDRHEKITMSLIEETEYCPGYWHQSEEIIDQNSFNHCNNEKEILPVKFYSYHHTTALLKQNRFDVLYYKVYHHDKGVKLFDRIFGTDCGININLKIKEKNGRDLYVCAVPR